MCIAVADLCFDMMWDFNNNGWGSFTSCMCGVRACVRAEAHWQVLARSAVSVRSCPVAGSKHVYCWQACSASGCLLAESLTPRLQCVLSACIWCAVCALHQKLLAPAAVSEPVVLLVQCTCSAVPCRWILTLLLLSTAGQLNSMVLLYQHAASFHCTAQAAMMTCSALT